MLDFILAIIKGAPGWLQVTLEFIVVAFIGMLAVSFIGGVWIAFGILRMKAPYIAEVQMFPPKIIFVPKGSAVKSEELPRQ